jgi:hypothetical protein
MSNTIHTGTMTEAEANALHDELRAIMKETGLPFGPAVDEYIAKRYLTDATGSAKICHTDPETPPSK